ncbi:MAG: hypothetical protein FJW96_15720, partial [Actinobacteria bacterium]|nr:hypothetical protein [Actinomycetota bacterium]
MEPARYRRALRGRDALGIPVGCPDLFACTDGSGGSIAALRGDAAFFGEEMLFVLSGRPLFRSQAGEERLAPGDVVSCPEGRAGLHAFGNPTEEPV